MTAEASGRLPSRPNILAFPSATTARVFLLLAAIVSAGAFVGISVHDWLLARSYASAYNACSAGAALRGPVGSTAYSDYLELCFRPTQIRRGLFALGGGLTLVLLLMVTVPLAQLIISRRRPGKAMTQYFAGSGKYLEELRNASGVNSNTMILVGPSQQRDAFTYGAFGRYRIQLPRGLAVKWRTRDLFEPVLLHECAHIFHRDVKWGWFARAAWYAVVPLLLAALIPPVLQHDWGYFLSYAWRAILLVVITQLLIRSFLRARETDADLRAAQVLHDVTDITAVIGRNTSRLSRLPALLAFHPSAQKRISSILDPASTVRVSFVDGFTAALTAALPGGIVLGIAENLLLGVSDGSSKAQIIFVGIYSAPLGFAVGGGVLRSLMVSRVTGQPPSAAAPALGVGIGVAIGLLASLAQTGVGVLAGNAQPWEIAVPACAGIAATAYTAAIARLWAFTVPLAARPRVSWITYCVLATAIFWVVGWMSVELGSLLDNYPGAGIWDTLRRNAGNAIFLIPSWTLLVIFLAIGSLVGGLLFLRQRDSSPSWLLDNGGRVTWDGFARRTGAAIALMAAASVLGAVAMVTIEESVTQGADLFYSLVGTSVLTGVCGGLAASAVTPRIGGAAALPAAIVSCSLSLGLAVAAGTVLHLPLNIHRLSSVALPGITASALASVFCVPLAVRAATLAAKAG